MIISPSIIMLNMSDSSLTVIQNFTVQYLDGIVINDSYLVNKYESSQFYYIRLVVSDRLFEYDDLGKRDKA